MRLILFLLLSCVVWQSASAQAGDNLGKAEKEMVTVEARPIKFEALQEDADDNIVGEYASTSVSPAPTMFRSKRSTK